MTQISLPSNHFLINVTLTKIADKAQMEESGEFHWVSDIFDGRVWTDSYSIDGKDVPNVPSGGETVYLLKEFGLGKVTSSEPVIRWGLNERSEFASDGYRPSTVSEGRALIKVHPELLLESDLVILGSFTMNNHCRCVATLSQDDETGRSIDCIKFDTNWFGCSFLLVRK